MLAVVSLSGGMDSATVLAHAVDTRDEVLAVSFEYGSKHNPYERECAKWLCEYYDVELLYMNFTEAARQFNSNLLRAGGEIPEGHYEQSNMNLTVVPGRNLIFISFLAGLAWSRRMEDVERPVAEVYLGIHQGDHAIYPDCRESFYFAMKTAVSRGTDERVLLQAPFLETNKTGILKRGLELDVPYEHTRTCYKDQTVACGKCGACQERLESFRENGVDDPVEYEFRGVLDKQ